jgi:hypothetical protein
MCTKRVFTKNNLDINYADYNSVKSGSEILKAIKSENKNAVLKQFKNFNSWQTMTSAYFKYIDNKEVNLTYLKNIYNSNESFIDKSCETIPNTCDSEKNILYPYGKIITKRIVNPSFPTNLYLCRWCNNNNIINDNNFKDTEKCQFNCIKKEDVINSHILNKIVDNNFKDTEKSNCVEKIDVKMLHIINKIDKCLEKIENAEKIEKIEKIEIDNKKIKPKPLFI